MEGKTVLITGATSGIGKETARELAKRGARVIMACRNVDMANQVKDELVKETNNQNIVASKLDLSSQQSVRDFATEFLKSENRLDVLVHNAGYGGSFKKVKSVDGIEITMATNHYGPFLLTHLLIDLLKKSAPSRIVVVASSFYRLADVNVNKLNPVDSWPAYLYYSSKGANILFTQELARKLEGTNVTANCLHPGLVDTGIWRNVPLPLKLPLGILNKLFFKTAPQGAETTIYLATSDEVAKTSGKYYSDCKEAVLRPYITEPEKAKKLWEESIKISNLQPTDPKI